MTRQTQLDRIERSLGTLSALTVALLFQGERIMATFDKLIAAVRHNTDASASLLQAWAALAAQIKDLGGPEAEALAAQVESDAQAMTEAVLAGTPAAVPPGGLPPARRSP